MSSAPPKFIGEPIEYSLKLLWAPKDVATCCAATRYSNRVPDAEEIDVGLLSLPWAIFPAGGFSAVNFYWAEDALNTLHRVSSNETLLSVLGHHPTSSPSSAFIALKDFYVQETTCCTLLAVMYLSILGRSYPNMTTRWRKNRVSYCIIASCDAVPLRKLDTNGMSEVSGTCLRSGLWIHAAGAQVSSPTNLCIM